MAAGRGREKGLMPNVSSVVNLSSGSLTISAVSPRLTCDELASALVQVRGDHVPHGRAKPSLRKGASEAGQGSGCWRELFPARRRRRRQPPPDAPLHGQKTTGKEGESQSSPGGGEARRASSAPSSWEEKRERAGACFAASWIAVIRSRRP